MDKLLKQEILYRIKAQPNLIKSLSRRYYFDLDFYRTAISLNINCYFFLPDEYKDDEEIVNLIIRNASTNYLKFPYSELKTYNKGQKNAIVIINSIICFINLYKDIYGVDREFEKEIFFDSVTEGDAIYRDIFEPLSCLDVLEKNYIIYKYGLYDGKKKYLTDAMNYFHLGYDSIIKLESNSITKLKKYVKDNGFRLGKNRR